MQIYLKQVHYPNKEKDGWTVRHKRGKLFCYCDNFIFNLPAGVYFYNMSFDTGLRDHYLRGHEKYLRHISVDCIIFGLIPGTF